MLELFHMDAGLRTFTTSEGLPIAIGFFIVP